MNGSMRVAIGDGDEAVCRQYQSLLSKLGHTIVGTCSSGDQLVELIESARPDVAVVDVDLQGKAAVDAAAACWETAPTPFLLACSKCDDGLSQRAASDGVFGLIHKPVTASGLAAAIAIARFQFERLQQAHTDLIAMRQTLQDRKVIERAKGVLMKRAGLAEDAAFRRLQKLSWDRNQKLVQVAQMILMAEQALDSPDAVVAADIIGGRDGQLH